MSNAMIPVSDIERMAAAVAKSGLFGVKQPEQAMALMLIAQAEGLHPAIAARDYHIIQGRPALKADAMLARFQQAGGKVEWKDYTDASVSGTFSHPSGGSITIQWTLDMATKAGLTKNPTWRQYPRQMLRARCISEGIRTVFPGVVSGFYTPEEVQDFAPQPERDITPRPSPMPEKVKEAAKPRKADKPVASPVIEGTATTISGDPAESDLSDIAPTIPAKPTQQRLDNVKAAFASIGKDAATEYGKPLEDWTEEDMVEAQVVFKALRASMQEPAI